jgi:hypothetical protein
VSKEEGGRKEGGRGRRMEEEGGWKSGERVVEGSKEGEENLQRSIRPSGRMR